METHEDSNTEREIFERALEISSPEERLEFLKVACGGEGALLNRQQALLLAEERTRDALLGAPSKPKSADQSEGAGRKSGAHPLLKGFSDVRVARMMEWDQEAQRRLSVMADALERLSGVDLPAAQLLKLRCLWGLSNGQAAEIIGIPEQSADPRWAYARAWFYEELGRGQ